MRVSTSVRGARRRINGRCCSFLFGSPFRALRAWQPAPAPERYPFTLIVEKDNTARPEVGRPMEIAGRNVVM